MKEYAKLEQKLRMTGNALDPIIDYSDGNYLAEIQQGSRIHIDEQATVKLSKKRDKTQGSKIEDVLFIQNDRKDSDPERNFQKAKRLDSGPTGSPITVIPTLFREHEILFYHNINNWNEKGQQLANQRKLADRISVPIKSITLLVEHFRLKYADISEPQFPDWLIYGSIVNSEYDYTIPEIENLPENDKIWELLFQNMTNEIMIENKDYSQLSLEEWNERELMNILCMLTSPAVIQLLEEDIYSIIMMEFYLYVELLKVKAAVTIINELSAEDSEKTIKKNKNNEYIHKSIRFTFNYHNNHYFAENNEEFTYKTNSHELKSVEYLTTLMKELSGMELPEISIIYYKGNQIVAECVDLVKENHLVYGILNEVGENLSVSKEIEKISRFLGRSLNIKNHLIQLFPFYHSPSPSSILLSSSIASSFSSPSPSPRSKPAPIIEIPVNTDLRAFLAFVSFSSLSFFLPIFFSPFSSASNALTCSNVFQNPSLLLCFY